MKKKIETNEYLVIVYRFLVLMLIYSILRITFYLFNTDLFHNITLGGFARLMYGGFRFDISALIYLNLLFFVLYILSFRAKFNKTWSRIVNGIFFTFNCIGIGANCCDFIYYRFILKRTTFNIKDVFANEDNIFSLWGQFLIDYWYVALYFIVIMYLFVKATLFIRPKLTPIRNNVGYGALGVVVLALIAFLSVGGIRGGFRHSTRPITLSNAAAYTASPEESAIVLNTPFSIIRTIGKKSFVKYNFFSSDEIEHVYTPIHEARPDSIQMRKMNVVIFILESFSREFMASFNPNLENGNYKGYTPFIDSLAQHSLIFPHAYANGRKSIDAMPSVLASVPSLTMPYVVSEYSNNKVNSIASILGNEGYTTAFFHGAPNGSMGFDAFAKIAGFQQYKGKDEYGNDDDFDGMWGIWDDKFFQYYANEIGNLPEPFCTALFSLSSHHPFKVPARYEGVFPKGNIPLHQCIGYSDNALRMFFDNARKQPWFNNTLFVLTADHNIPGDHVEYKTNANAFAIPIIFYCPTDTTLVGRDEQLAQQADIMPTILSYLGYNKPFVSFGSDLFDKNQQRFVVNYNNDVYQIYMNDTIAYFDGRELIGAYDLITDPMLEHNVLTNNNVKDLDQRIKAYVQQYDDRMITDNLTIK